MTRTVHFVTGIHWNVFYFPAFRSRQTPIGYAIRDWWWFLEAVQCRSTFLLGLHHCNRQRLQLQRTDHKHVIRLAGIQICGCGPSVFPSFRRHAKWKKSVWWRCQIAASFEGCHIHILRDLMTRIRWSHLTNDHQRSVFAQNGRLQHWQYGT